MDGDNKLNGDRPLDRNRQLRGIINYTGLSIDRIDNWRGIIN
jgi:hypothetical protein